MFKTATIKTAIQNFFSPRRKLNSMGFTLVEIMIVLAILGAIFGLLAGRVVGARDKAKIKEAKIQMGQLQNALSMYYTDCGKYPASLENLKTKDSACSNWGPEAYFSKSMLDPWQHEYAYESSGGDYSLKSYGKDGAEGGDGYNADVSSEGEEAAAKTE